MMILFIGRPSGRTALMAASFMENNEIVEDLLRGGADANVRPPLPESEIKDQSLDSVC